jgi:glucosylceramidase
MGWNLALDENGKPNIGPFSCGGVVTIDSKTHAITRSGQYWALAHYSRVVRRGAVHVATESSADIKHVAFANPDGSMAAVITNKGAAKTLQLRAGGSSAELAMTEDSVATLTWKG